MDMLPTLCTAMKRAGGDALVLRTGDSPHVLTANGRQNVARAILSANALEALVAQIFTGDGRQTLHDTGRVVEQVTVREAVGLVAQAAGYSYRFEGNTVHIATEQRLGALFAPSAHPASIPKTSSPGSHFWKPSSSEASLSFQAIGGRMKRSTAI